MAEEGEPADEIEATEQAPQDTCSESDAPGDVPNEAPTSLDEVVGVPDAAIANDEGDVAATDPAADPAQDQGWVREGDATYYYRNGAPLTGEQLLPREDGSGEAWYWLGSDGRMARSADVYIPEGEGRKWVRCGADGAMLTGEHYANDPADGHVGWYHFDEQTRAMSFGLTELPSGKTVFYDKTTGVMRFGERCAGGSWYLFERGTGAMQTGWRYLPSSGGKWVYYDPDSGCMSKGERYVTDGEQGWCYFNPVTGATTFGWSYHDGAWHFYKHENGRALTGERYVTDGEQGWCFFNEDRGTLHQGFRHLPQYPKWVYYDINTGRMRVGEQCIDGNWYLFDSVTGAMQTGWRHLSSNGGKWVYYDPIDGKMARGEKYAIEGIKGWYLFDSVTGAMQTGWRHLSSSGGKLVHYDLQTGRMDMGERYITDGEHGWCLFNTYDGNLQYGLQYIPWLNKVVYYDRNSGRMRFGWQRFGNVSLFFDPATGAMQADGFDVLVNSTRVEGLAETDDSVAHILAGEHKHVRIIGDSISGGWGVVAAPICDGAPIGADVEGMRYEPSCSTPMWANELRKYVCSRGGTLFNASVPTKGFSWFDALGSKLPDNGQDHFDLTVFMLGTNDREKDPEALAASVRSVLGKAQTTSERVVVVIPEAVGYTSAQASGSDMVGQVLRRVCAERGVATIDALAAFESTSRTVSFSNRDLFSDGVHLTLVGQAVLWNIVARGFGIR